ncbi:hypothetical protein D9615_001054 [Tricholomella constricta]|uniref:Uncharacterized protein n=1 Tax=Tricholomella constricta TaxID=117010 RepID=A0A8H5HK15_9AGAR|nr:hypothetical protein D9615_001054 [Tricholomella constricta]
MVSLFGHVVGVRGVRIHPWDCSISLYDVSYSYTSVLSISSPHLHISLHLPTPSNPTFMTATLYDYDYTDTAHRVSLSKLHLTFALFPVVPDTLIAAVLDDFRVRVFTSENTPPWLQTLRGNLIRTVLNGEHIRLDDFNTKFILSTTGIRGSTLTIPNDGDTNTEDLANGHHDLPGSYKSGESCPDVDDEEAVVSLNASEWHIKNFQDRLYSFGSVDAQLRRAWDPQADRGSFVLIAKNSCWVLAPNPPPTEPTVSRSILCTLCAKPLHLLQALLSPLPLALKTIHDPASAITLHVPRLDVTFDRFRLQDAELVRQGAEFVRRRYVLLQEKEEMDVGDFLQDMLMQGILGGKA